MGKSAPKGTNPKDVARGQTGSAVGTALANSFLANTNQVTPDGLLDYSTTGFYKYKDPYTKQTYKIPIRTATQTLSPEQAAIKSAKDGATLSAAQTMQRQAGMLGSVLNRPLSADQFGPRAQFSGLKGFDGAAPQLAQSYGGADNFSADRDKTEAAILERMRPQQDRDKAALDTSLANQGIMMGSAAYSAAMDDRNRGLNDARLGAILSSGQEQSRLVDMARDAASFGNDTQLAGFNAAMARNQANNQTALSDFSARAADRQQAIGEEQGFRNSALNEYLALQGGSQIGQPNYVNSNNAQIPTTDVAGIIGQSDAQRMQAYQAKQQQIGGLMGGIASLFALSDKRAKTDIKEVGGLYEYRYKGDPKGKKRIGVMAQEVEKIKPKAVRKRPDGMKEVNYGELFMAGA
ncbi:MAG: tail fiber domain-containing protein [Rhizobiaceae bacterium]